MINPVAVKLIRISGKTGAWCCILIIVASIVCLIVIQSRDNASPVQTVLPAGSRSEPRLHAKAETEKKSDHSTAVRQPGNDRHTQSDKQLLLKKFRSGAIKLLDPKGILTSNAIDVLGLSETESIELQNIISNHRVLLAQEAQKHLAVDPLRSKDNTSAFILRAFPEKGQAIKSDMLKAAAGLLGDSRGHNFEAMFPRLNYGGDFGTLEIRLSTVESELSDTVTGFGVVYESIYPDSGSPFGGGSVPVSKISEELGLVLAIAH